MRGEQDQADHGQGETAGHGWVRDDGVVPPEVSEDAWHMNKATGEEDDRGPWDDPPETSADHPNEGELGSRKTPRRATER
jgi:hypothetical protein